LILVLEWDGDHIEINDGECTMSLYISPTILKQQVKLVVKHWPFAKIPSHQARLILCQLYGFKNQHDYLKAIELRAEELTQIDQRVVLAHYTTWVKQLAEFASINQIQAKNLLQLLWPMYLSQDLHRGEKLYQCRIKFHGSCRDFLETSACHEWVEYRFDDKPSVKDTIEAMGVPHPEVGGIRVNQAWVGFNYSLADEDVIDVFPSPHESQLLPYKPDGETVFLLDVHLSKLARYLRMAGFSCLHQAEDLGDALLAHLSKTHDYILLTRDLGLLKRGDVRYARWVRSTDPYEQFCEIVSHYQLARQFRPFSRCVKCDGNIKDIDKPLVEGLVPNSVFETQVSFRQCAGCEQIYWKGTHYEKIQHIIQQAL